VVTARYAPVPDPTWARHGVAHPICLLLLGLVNNTAFFIGAFAGPEAEVLPLWPTLLTLLLLGGVTLGLMLRWSGSAFRWDDRHRLAWIVGLLGFLLPWGILADLEEQWTGKSIVSAISIVALCWLYRRVASRHRPVPAGSRAGPSSARLRGK
jgi:hypothetical protein